MSAVRGSGETPPINDDLSVVTKRVPPPSQTNDALVIGTAIAAALCALVFAITLLLGKAVAVHGTMLALSLLLLAIAVRRYFVDRYPDVEAVEPRYATDGSGEAGAHGGISDVEPISRRPLLTRVLIACAAILGLSFLAPVSSLGPAPGNQLRTTAWRRGRRLVTEQGEPVRPGDIAPGGVVTAWPEGAIGVEPSAVVVLRLTAQPQPPTNPDWVVDSSVVAYSKICTHAGCPVALYRERDNALFCPCHQSTFDVARGAVPTFGPAARALPQLPLDMSERGELVALGDFVMQVGPAFG
ncbi:MAG: ubiquinol-cytochrome c reductase iron-sulfur subunit [Egibacteraceae bacterium]